MKNWVRMSVGLATFGFITIMLFIVISTPVGTVFDTIQSQANDTGVGTEVAPFFNMIRTVFGLTFVLSMIGLVVWFFLGSHEEEHEQF